MKNRLTTENLAVIAMLSAVAFLLAFIKIPMPLSPILHYQRRQVKRA